MLDIKFVRENPEIVKENIKKKFKESKLPLAHATFGVQWKNFPNQSIMPLIKYLKTYLYTTKPSELLWWYFNFFFKKNQANP